MPHYSAKASHYNEEAEHYDAFNEEGSLAINLTLQNLLKKYEVKTVLDLSCGTGSQVFWLAKYGYQVTGSDINAKMLAIARFKAKRSRLSVKLLEGDMRTLQAGKFDAVITIFNSIGHLTTLDFEKALNNIHTNLKEGGLYIFDINNLSYLAKGDHITRLTIDWHKINGDIKTRYIQYSTVDINGLLESHTTSYTQRGSNKTKISRSVQVLQIYTANQLKTMLHRNGFTVVHQCGIDGSKFVEDRTDRIVTTSKKR